MEPHHFSSQTHDADSAAYIKHQKTIQEQAKRIAELEKKLQDANGYAQTLEWARDKAQQENKELSYHIEFVLKKRINELEFTVKSFDAEISRSHARIKELEAENKALRFNLADWKHKAEEMELTAKSFDAEIARSHERIQKLTNENADLVMEAEKLQERIKELEDKVQMKDFFWEGSGLSKRGYKNTIEVANYIEDLESRQPKWISVEDDEKPKEDEEILFTDGEFIYKGCWTTWDGGCSDFSYVVGSGFVDEVNDESFTEEQITHWMLLPEAPKSEY